MIRATAARALLAAAIALLDAPATPAQPVTSGAARRPVVIGSKPFGESSLLAELFAQLL